jgi:hypothetical protein
MSRPHATIRTDSTSTFQSFYMDYRILTAFAFGGPERDFPIFTSLTQYDRTDASKLKCMVNLVKHLLTDDRIEVPEYQEDGSVYYPDPPPLAPGEVRPQKRKIMMHQEFVMMSILVESVSFGLPVQGSDPLNHNPRIPIGFQRQRHQDRSVEWQSGL